MKLLRWSLILSLTFAAADSPTAIPEMMLDRRGIAPTSISKDLLDVLDLYSQYAAAAYCNSERPIGSVVNCSGGACPNVTAAGAKIIATYSGTQTDIRGFVSTDPTNHAIVVSIRGSETIRNWIADVQFLQKDCSFVSDCKVHEGFAKSWSEISSTVLSVVQLAKLAYPDYKIVFTGHSLGGAVSSLGAAYVRQAGFEVDIINFGSPRVGNGAFATFLTKSPGHEYRVTHLDDPVPLLPPIFFGYAHTSPELWLSNGGGETDDYDANDILECFGIQSINCNAAAISFDFVAHLHYFGPITACAPNEINF